MPEARLSRGTVVTLVVAGYSAPNAMKSQFRLLQSVKWDWIVKSFGGAVTVIALGIVAFSLGETIGIHGWPSFLVPLTGSLTGYPLAARAGFLPRVATNLLIWTSAFYGMGWISSRIPADWDFF